MNKSLHYFGLSLLSLFVANVLSAQVSLAPDQNPSFAVSRDKYMRTADSLTKTEGTTIHATYRAYDWFEAREERKKEQREWRQAIQLERARNPYPYYHTPYYRSYRNRNVFHQCPY